MPLVLTKCKIYILILSLDMALKPPLYKVMTIRAITIKNIDYSGLKHNESVKTVKSIIILKKREIKKISSVIICCDLL